MTRWVAFWLGFSSALGLLLGGAVLALARDESPSTIAIRPGPLASASLRIFAAEGPPSTAIPPAVQAEAQELVKAPPTVPADQRPGDVAVERGRLALTNIGSWRGAAYVFPTEKGHACYVVIGGPSGCSSEFPDRFPVGVNVFDRDGDGPDPPAVIGIAPDDVNGVAVVTGGSSAPAALENNMYFHQSAAGKTAYPNAVVVTFTDGRTARIDIPPIDVD